MDTSDTLGSGKQLDGSPCRYSLPVSPHAADAGYGICAVHKTQILAYGRGDRIASFKPLAILGERNILDKVPDHLRLDALSLSELILLTTSLVPKLRAPYESFEGKFESSEVDALYVMAYWTDLLWHGAGLRSPTRVHLLSAQLVRSEVARALLSYPVLSRSKYSRDVGNFMADAATYSASLSFPLFESAMRYALSSFIDSEGMVKVPFPRANGSVYKVGTKCSSLKDLVLFATTDGGGLALEIRQSIKYCLGTFHDSANVTQGLNVIYDLRNAWSHGNSSLALYGLRLGLVACLPVAGVLEPVFDKRRADFQAQLLTTPASTCNSATTHFPPLFYLWNDVRFLRVYMDARGTNRVRQNGLRTVRLGTSLL